MTTRQQPQLQICAWCGCVLRAGVGPASHGICVPCRNAVMDGGNFPHSASVTRQVREAVGDGGRAEDGDGDNDDPRHCENCEWRDDCELVSPWRAPCRHWRIRVERVGMGWTLLGVALVWLAVWVTVWWGWR